MTSADAGRAAVKERSGGRCEVTGGRAEEVSHRTSRGRGGRWDPVNLMHMTSRAHRLCHAYPTRAYELGWFVQTGHDPARVPVWLLLPFPGWWLLSDLGDGGPHVLIPLDEEDLIEQFGSLYCDPATGEIRIPAPPKWAPVQDTPMASTGRTTHAHV